MSRAAPLTDVTALIFDMDGVLVDSEPTNFEAMLRLLERYGIAYTEADDRRFRGRRNLDLYAYLRESYPGLPGDAELEDELTALTLGSIRRRCAPMPGVPDVLESTRRRGYRLALASSAVAAGGPAPPGRPAGFFPVRANRPRVLGAPRQPAPQNIPRGP